MQYLQNNFAFCFHYRLSLSSPLSWGNYLEYQALFHEPAGEHHGQHIGILFIELGVLCGVSGAMLTIFYAFAGRVAEIRDEDW